MFIKDHTHPCIKKFSLKKYIRSHKGIPKEEREFVKLMHNKPFSWQNNEDYGRVSIDVSNYMATIDAEPTHKDMAMLLDHIDNI
jgi:hypothetical protein